MCVWMYVCTLHMYSSWWVEWSVHTCISIVLSIFSPLIDYRLNRSLKNRFFYIFGIFDHVWLIRQWSKNRFFFFWNYCHILFKFNVYKSFVNYAKNNLKINFLTNTLLFHISIKLFQNLKKNWIPRVLHPWIGPTKQNKSIEPVSTWQSITEMTMLGSEATIMRLHNFIFLCRTNPWVKYPRNSTSFLILKECYIDMK